MKNTKTKKKCEEKIPAPVIELDKYRKSDGHTEPVAGGQSTEHCMQFLVDCLSCIALLPPQNPLRLFAPRFPERLSCHGSGSALSATGSNLGEPQTPIAVTSTVYDHLPTAWLPIPCKWALQGAGAVPSDLKSPG